ncbi:MAG: hypothetical protein ACTSXZ_09965 [Alphaproteobacteria bacterium]
MTQVHRMFFHYSDFPLSMRALYTGALLVLGIGYLFAMLHTYNSHAGRDGLPGLSVHDLMIAYSGNKEDSRIEAALKGPMAEMLPADEKNVFMAWVRGGAREDVFDAKLAPVIQKRCLACHDGGNPHIANLDGYKNVAAFAELDTGADIFTLVRVSHIHLFGITFIFFIVGLIFTHAFIRPVWFKALVIVAPFVAIILDIASWYLTKLFTPFAWIVLLSGAIMGMCFAYMWVVSMYQIWFPKFSREGEVPDVSLL